jgi:hypothetical protein
LWATGSKCLPIEDHHHFRGARQYIRDHEQKGAVIYVCPSLPGMEQFDPDTLRLD